MSFIDKVDRKLGRYLSLPNLMIYVTATMLVVYMLDTLLTGRVSYWIAFDRGLIIQGQVWRLISFIFAPPASSAFTLVISLYFFYFIGSSLENVWGSSRFTIYYLFGIVGAVISGLIAGGTTNYYLNLSLFFAFAHLFPNHQVMLFFVIPIKVKYLAWLNWAYFAFSLITSLIGGFWSGCLAILFAILNFLLFFGKELVVNTKNGIQARKRRKKFQQQMKDNDIWR